MKLKVINSNSSGNAYIIEGKDTAFLLECGVRFQQIKEAIDHQLIKIDACAVTHLHNDHSKCLSQIVSSGMAVISNKETFDHKKIPVEARYCEIEHGQTTSYKGWKVSAFSVQHDVKTLGYIIEHQDCGKVLFITDTYLMKWKFPFEFDHVIIEANYCEDLLQKIQEKKGIDFINRRRFKSHMSFQTAHKTLDNLNLSNCRNIVLIHLSDGITNEKEFKVKTEERYGINTTVAVPNTVVNFSINPF